MSSETIDDSVTIGHDGQAWCVSVTIHSRTTTQRFIEQGDARAFASRKQRLLATHYPAVPRSLEGEAGIIATNGM